MKKLLSLALIALILSGCIFRIHKMDVEQGNIIPEQNLKSLRVGMSELEVKEIMGSPVLVNIIKPNEIDYVYTFQTGYEPMLIKRVLCVFKNGVLKDIVVLKNLS